MNCIEFYTSLIQTLGLDTSEADVLVKPNGEALEIEEKPVVLPSKMYLNKNEWDDVVPFHPLCEDALHGQSPVFKAIYNVAVRTLIMRYSALIKDIIAVGNDKDLQSKISNPDMMEILKAYPDIKPGVSTTWSKIYKKLAEDKRPMLGLFIKNNQTIDGDFYQRVGRVYVPILEEDEENIDDKILGVEVKPKKAVKGIRNIVHKVMGDLNEMTIKSNDRTPTCKVLLEFLYAAFSRYNELVEGFGEAISSEPVTLDWYDEIDNIDRFGKLIPKLPYNNGISLSKEEKQNAGVELDDVSQESKSLLNASDDEDNSRLRNPERRSRPGMSKRGQEKASGGSLLDQVYDDEEDRLSRRRSIRGKRGLRGNREERSSGTGLLSGRPNRERRKKSLLG
jgi:hypothetical protein